MITDNKIIIRFNIFAILSGEAATLLPLVMFLIGLWKYASKNNPTYTVNTIGIIALVLMAAICLVAWFIFTFSIIHTFQIVLRNNGIIKYLKIKLFSLKLYESTVEFKWEDVSMLKWEYMGLLSGYHISGKDQSGKNAFLILSIMMSNRNQALKFMVDRLPKEKIDKKLFDRYATL